MTEQDSMISQLKKRLANARKRVAFWSGRPSFRGFGFKPKATIRDADLRYEMALDDVRSLACELESLVGKQFSVTDLREEYNAKFVVGLHSALNS